MVRTIIRKLGFVAAILLAVSGLPVNAGLIGQAVEVDYLYPYPDHGGDYQILGMGTVTGAGFTVNSFGQHNYTVADTQITLQNVTPGYIDFGSATFNGYELIETGGSPVMITGVTVNGATNVSGFDPSRVSFDDHHVFLNMQSLITQSSNKVFLDVATVPEPATVALLAFGLAAVGLVRKLR